MYDNYVHYQYKSVLSDFHFESIFMSVAYVPLQAVTRGRDGCFSTPKTR